MPDQERSHRREPAILWPLESFDDTGQPVVGNPEEVRVRWEAATEESDGATGITAQVVLDRKVDIGSAMWRGELSAWSGARPDEGGDDVMQVIAYDEITDVKGRARLRVAQLARFRNSWPNTSESAIRVDTELSSISYSAEEAVADDTDEIVISIQLVDSDGDEIGGRQVFMRLSNDDDISFENSPQITDDEGNVELRLRADAPTTVTVTISTLEDGELFDRTSIEFTEA